MLALLRALLPANLPSFHNSLPNHRSKAPAMEPPASPTRNVPGKSPRTSWKHRLHCCLAPARLVELRGGADTNPRHSAKLRAVTMPAAQRPSRSRQEAEPQPLAGSCTAAAAPGWPSPPNCCPNGSSGGCHSSPWQGTGERGGKASTSEHLAFSSPHPSLCTTPA